MNTNRMTVLYHNNCYDGVTAAWVCARALRGERPNLRFIPMNYSDPIPADIDGDDVVMVDFSFKRPLMEELYRRVNSLIVLDHHKTAEVELANFEPDTPPEVSNLDIVFDMNRSGAGIAWDYFFSPDTRPLLVKYVEDRDLWRYALPYSRQINAYIQSYDIDLVEWLNVFKDGAEDLANTVEVGEALLRQQSKLVRQITEHARFQPLPTPSKITDAAIDLWRDKNLDGQMGIFVNAPILMSEVCEQMLKDHPEARYAWYNFRRKDGKTQYGLRSRSNEDFDVSEIAKLYGGGGHKNAAGFEL